MSRLDPQFKIPEVGGWHRHIVCGGIEITCWHDYTAANFGDENCNRFRLHAGLYRSDFKEYPNTPQGIFELQSMLWILKTAFDQGMAHKLYRIQVELGIKS